MLKVGLLWFDDDSKRALAVRLDEAAERYEERFGVWPTLVLLNPAQAEGLAHRRLRVCGDPGMRRNYFLVGVDDSEAGEESLPVDGALRLASSTTEGPPPARSPRSRRGAAAASAAARRSRASRRAS